MASSLADARLLTVSDGTVELAHEALLREWPRLSGWIAEDRGDMRIRRAVGTAARGWVRLQRDDGALYRGTALTVALEWRARRKPSLVETEREFLELSEAQQERDRSARRRRLRLAAAGFAAVLIFVAVAVVVTVQQRRETSRTTSRDLANESSLVLPSDPGLALGVALWAQQEWDTGEARAAVRQATHEARATAVWQANDGWLYAAAPSVDGSELVTGGQDGTVRIWDLKRRRAVTTWPGNGASEAWDVAISPDGEQVAVAGSDGRVVVRNHAGDDPRVVLSIERAQPVSVQFSPDGSRLVVALSNGTVRIVGLRPGDADKTLKGHRGSILSARFNHDGSRVVSAW